MCACCARLPACLARLAAAAAAQTPKPWPGRCTAVFCRAKIVDGRVAKIAKEMALLEQQFIKDTSKTVAGEPLETLGPPAPQAAAGCWARRARGAACWAGSKWGAAGAQERQI